MTGRSIWASLILTTLAPAIALSQGLEIDHKAVGCIVVGKYPKMNACFTPTASFARGRVYFRPEGTPTWYYVDMKSDQPCLTGILPRPGKQLVGKHVEYYLEARTRPSCRPAAGAPIVVRPRRSARRRSGRAVPEQRSRCSRLCRRLRGRDRHGRRRRHRGRRTAAATTTAIVVSSNNNDTTTTTASGMNTFPARCGRRPRPPPYRREQGAECGAEEFQILGYRPSHLTFDMCSSTDQRPPILFFTFGDGSTASGSCIEPTYAAAFVAPPTT